MASNTISILLQAKDNASRVIDGLGGSLGHVENRSSAVGRGFAAMGAATLRATAALGTAAGAAVSASTVIGFKFNSAVEQAEAQLMAFTKSNTKTADILKYVKDEAARTQFSFTEMAQAAAGLIPASNQSGVALKDLIRQAEILAALNPAEGLTGAAFSLKEALSGDFVSIVERFNLPRKRLNELKEQGVPAMEAITIALKEMGIDYDLVAKQGQTTAARWDQIKDKFTQMAGEYTKPVFDRVSKGLDDLAPKMDKAKEGVDLFIRSFKIGDNLSEAPGALNTIGESAETLREVWDKTVEVGKKFWEGMQKAGDIAGQFFGPSLKALWSTIQEKLLPALQGLMPFFQVVGAIIGVAVVAAIWLLINALNVLVNVFSWVGQVVGNVAQWFIDRWNNITSVWRQAPEFFHRLSDSIGETFEKVKRAIGSAFDGAYEYVKSLPGKMVNLFTNLGGSIKRVIGDIDIPGPLGKVKDVIPGFAAGGYTGRGPANEVAGLVHRGEYVIPASQVDQATGRPKGGGGVTINQTNNIYNDVDLRQANERLGWDFANA